MANQKPIIHSGNGTLKQIATGDYVDPSTLGSGTPSNSNFLRGDGSWSTAVQPIAIDNKVSAYTVVASDNGRVINCTANTFTVSLTAAATLGAEFYCWVWNTSSNYLNAITVDPSGAETVDGLATLILRRGEGVQIICDGSKFQTASKKVMRGYSENLDTISGRPAAVGDGAIAIGASYASGATSLALQIANNSASYGAQGISAWVFGNTSLASGNYSLAHGNSNVANGLRSFAFGNICTATQMGSQATGYGTRSAQIGRWSYGVGWFSTNTGSAQRSIQVLRVATTGSTPAELTADEAAASAINKLNLENNSAYAFTGTVVAMRKVSDGTETAAWKIEGLLRRGVNAASTTLVASSVTAISNAPGWTLSLAADTTNGGLSITFTGTSATNIRTVADIQTVEVTYA